MPLLNRLKEYRSSKGINQTELGKLAGVSRQTISAIETGKYNPSLELAFAIADCFGEPIEKIFLYHEDTAVNRKESCGGRTCGVSAAQGGGTR